jgi:hypothetical protein
MRRIAFVLISLWFAAGIDQGICSAAPQDSTTVPPATSAFTLPRWRFMVAPMGYYDDPFASIARRVGRRVDLGLGVSGSVFGQHSDRESDSWSSNGDEDLFSLGDYGEGFSLLLHAELRKWTPRTPALATFFGLRASAGYGWDEGESSSETVRNTTAGRSDSWDEDTGSRESIRAGLGAVAGVDLQLLRHLSLNVTLAGLTAGVDWSRDDNDRRTRTDEDNVTRTRRDEDTYWTREVRLDLNLMPQHYLTLGF